MIAARYDGGIMDEPNATQTTADSARATVRSLLQCGENVAERVHDQILACGAAAIPPLLELLADESLMLGDAPGEGWAPIHAVGLLEQLHATEAVQPLLDVLAKADINEYIHSHALSALESLGQAALEPTLKAYAERPDHDFRQALASVLAGLKVEDERIYTILVDEMARDPGFIAGLFGQYGDARAIPLLSKTFVQYEIDRDTENPLANHILVEIKASIEDLGGELNDIQRAKFARAMKLAEQWRARFNAVMPKVKPVAHAAPKIGRNDPCPCNSGKKYKKCCLAKDESEHQRALDHAGDPVASRRTGQAPAGQMLRDFAQPLVELAESNAETVNEAIDLGVLFWNLALTKDERQREEMLIEAMDGMSATEQTSFRALANDMVQRHRLMFPELHR